jgi:hypothetical protein
MSFIEGRFPGRRVQTDAGVVDQNVDRSEALDCPLDYAAAHFCAREISGR